jgi:hypothetical protein
MARLTWRDVAAPDFTSASRMQELASRNLQQAFQQLEGGLEEFDGAQTDRVNREYMLRLAGMQTPEAAAAIAADPTLGADPRRISTASITAAMQRPGAIIQQAAAQFGLDHAKAKAPGELTLQDLSITDKRQNIDFTAREEARNQEAHGWTGEKTKSQLETEALSRRLAMNRDGREAVELNMRGEAHGWARFNQNAAREAARVDKARADEATDVAGQLLMAGSPEKAYAKARELVGSGAVDPAVIPLAMKLIDFKPLNGDLQFDGGDPLIAASRDKKTTAMDAALAFQKRNPDVDSREVWLGIKQIQDEAARQGRPMTAAMAAAIIEKNTHPGMRYPFSGQGRVGRFLVSPRQANRDDITNFVSGSSVPLGPRPPEFLDKNTK